MGFLRFVPTGSWPIDWIIGNQCPSINTDFTAKTQRRKELTN
jgi:hypothetical protein